GGQGPGEGGTAAITAWELPFSSPRPPAINLSLCRRSSLPRVGERPGGKKIAAAQPCAAATPQVGQHNGRSPAEGRPRSALPGPGGLEGGGSQPPGPDGRPPPGPAGSLPSVPPGGRALAC